MSDVDPVLSDSGIARRERILMLALDEAKSRRRKRWALRASAVGVVVAGIGLVVRSMTGSIAPPPVRPLAIQDPAPVPVPSPPGIVVSRLETDPTIVDRLAIQADSHRWQTIGDEELLRGLADAGRPTGLIHVAGQTLLLPRHARHP
jgi:hypothetical protein